MEKNQEQLLTEEWLKDVSRELETRSFKTEEMISCPKCARKSPPTRLTCVYCGADLPVTENHSEFIKPQSRRIEPWERAFNLIFLPNGKDYDEVKTGEVASLTQFEPSEIQKICGGTALPILRVETKTEAELLQVRLEKLGVKTHLVADEDLKLETPARRLRRIEFAGDRLVLVLFNSDDSLEIARENLALIVTGAIFERKIETTEQRKKRVNKPMNSVETSADETLVDIYTKDDPIGFRLSTAGFDFSTLGDDKEMFARENVRKLTEKLKNFAPEARFVEDYTKIRDLLGKIWEVEERRDSRGLQRKSFGRFEIGNVTTVNNLAQFTKYSRLQWHLL
jgi:hypothetical protein